MKKKKKTFKFFFFFLTITRLVREVTVGLQQIVDLLLAVTQSVQYIEREDKLTNKSKANMKSNKKNSHPRRALV